MDPCGALRVAVVELPATWAEPASALARVDALLAGGPPTDLLVLPEASLTGYVSPDGEVDLTPFAEPHDGPTARALASMAVRHRTHIVGPLILSEDLRLYNAMACFDPAGRSVFVYRKRHPWFPESWASAGEAEAPVVSLRGVAVTIATCFDVHFLDEDATASLSRADLLLFPSAWVDDDPRGRAAVLEAVARRHGVSIANANWGPGSVCLPGQGASCILDETGAVLAEVAPGRERADAVVRPKATVRGGVSAAQPGARSW